MRSSGSLVGIGGGVALRTERRLAVAPARIWPPPIAVKVELDSPSIGSV
jgi:hypothetical protein